MEEIILRFMPNLQNYPVFLILVEIISFLFFGGFVFSAIWSLFDSLFRG